MMLVNVTKEHIDLYLIYGDDEHKWIILDDACNLAMEDGRSVFFSSLHGSATFYTVVEALVRWMNDMFSFEVDLCNMRVK